MTDEPIKTESSEESTTVAGSGDQIHVSGNIINSTIIIKSVVTDKQAVDLENLPPEAGDAPYQGLQYFTERDAGRFFGREQLTARVIGRLQRTRFLAIIGASGSGKSSLVRAGVVPALKSGARLADDSLPPAGSTQWSYRIITPGGHPLDALAATLSKENSLPSQIKSLRDELAHDPNSFVLAAQSVLAVEGTSHLFMVVDQLEEIFTQSRDTEERDAFIKMLATTSSPDDSQPISVMVCLRADFYAQVAQHDSLRELVSQYQEFIGAMSRAELVDAIVGPLTQGNWKIQVGLVNVILDAVGYEPGALPLLSHALLETWERRRGRTLTLSGYVEVGGVDGAIRKTADAVFNQRLSPDQRPIARLIFLHLAELNENAQDTRRRASFDELITRSTDEKTIKTVINILVDARLVTTSTLEPGNTEVVEVAHESLIREWPTLRQWLSEDRQGLILHRQLTEAAEDWIKEGRDPGLLYRGKRLAQIQEWGAAADNSNALSLQEVEFLEASEANAKEERAKEQRLTRLRRTQQIFAGIIVPLVLLVGILTYTSLRPKPPPVMNGLYNIAIAQISEISPAGQIQPLPNDGGVKLSQDIADALQESLKSNSSILIWNDNPELKRQRVQLGILNSTQTAQDLAYRLHADMIISGTLDQRQQPPVLNIQMYLAPRLSNALDEVNGSFSLNTPIPVTTDLDADSVKSDLTRQTNLLAMLALGQSNSQLGFNLEALESYLKAAELAPDSDIIQFFIGREYLFTLDREPVLQVARDAFQQKALEALQKSLQLNPQNARAYIGLGSLYLKQAKQLVKEGSTAGYTQENLAQATKFLDQADTSYGTVLQLNVDPNLYGVPVPDIARLGLGDSQVTRGFVLEANKENDAASAAFQDAAHALEATLPAFQDPGFSRYLAQNYEFLGSAYQNIGYLASEKGDFSTATANYQKAIEQFDACIALGANSNDRVIQDDIVAANCQPLRQQTEDYLGGGP